jgi:hypothetical protein
LKLKLSAYSKYGGMQAQDDNLFKELEEETES